jgi:hypothetical protein
MNMSPFHSGMNHWQRQWLSDRLHKKHLDSPPAQSGVPAAISKPKQQRRPKSKQKPTGQE